MSDDKLNGLRQVEKIADAAIKQKLEGGYKALSEQDHGTALVDAAVAFILVQRAHVRILGASAPPHMPVTLSQKMGSQMWLHFERDESLKKVAESVKDSLALLAEAVEIIGYGLDYKEYMLFLAHKPFVHQLIGGDMMADWSQEPTADVGIVARSLNFVSDAAVAFGV
ncbi:MAG: hypothetical protein WCC64_05295 [Aliidongia sp.]